MVLRAVFESVGIKNVLAKSQGSSNPHNVAKATIKALLSLRDANTVAHQRGEFGKSLTIRNFKWQD